jgi:hypothetical protein
MNSNQSDEFGPSWWNCATHGRAQKNAWGCPECVRELRVDKAVLLDTLAELCGAYEKHTGRMSVQQWKAYDYARDILARYRVDPPDAGFVAGAESK